MVVLVRAHGLTRTGAGGGVGSENITVHVVPLSGLGGWLKDRERGGILVDMKVWAALHFVTASP
jgi:ADP-ribose pyrophosphatase